jgi:hypothetical protein
MYKYVMVTTYRDPSSGHAHVLREDFDPSTATASAAEKDAAIVARHNGRATIGRPDEPSTDPDPATVARDADAALTPPPVAATTGKTDADWATEEMGAPMAPTTPPPIKDYEPPKAKGK